MREIAPHIALLTPYVRGSLFKDFPWVPDADLAQDDQFGLYVYLFNEPAEGFKVRLYFAKPKTEEQRNKAFLTDKVTVPQDWDPVLEWIIFGKETGFPLSQNTINQQGKRAIVKADRWLVPRGYRPGQNLETVVIVEHFLSEVNWPDWALESDEPQPTEVMWDLVGSHGSMGKVLHDTIPVPAQSSASYTVVTSVGTPQVGGSTAQKSFIFPKTNHKKRRDWFKNVVTVVNGQYYRQKKTYIAPLGSKIVKESLTE